MRLCSMLVQFVCCIQLLCASHRARERARAYCLCNHFVCSTKKTTATNNRKAKLTRLMGKVKHFNEIVWCRVNTCGKQMHVREWVSSCERVCVCVHARLQWASVHNYFQQFSDSSPLYAEIPESHSKAICLKSDRRSTAVPYYWEETNE